MFFKFHALQTGENGEEIITAKSFACDDFTTWQTVLDHFVGFLGNVYGFDIGDKVEIVERGFK